MVPEKNPWICRVSRNPSFLGAKHGGVRLSTLEPLDEGADFSARLVNNTTSFLGYSEFRKPIGGSS